MTDSSKYEQGPASFSPVFPASNFFNLNRRQEIEDNEVNQTYYDAVQGDNLRILYSAPFFTSDAFHSNLGRYFYEESVGFGTIQEVDDKHDSGISCEVTFEDMPDQCTGFPLFEDGSSTQQEIIYGGAAISVNMIGRAIEQARSEM